MSESIEGVVTPADCAVYYIPVSRMSGTNLWQSGNPSRDRAAAEDDLAWWINQGYTDARIVEVSLPIIHCDEDDEG